MARNRWDGGEGLGPLWHGRGMENLELMGMDGERRTCSLWLGNWRPHRRAAALGIRGWVGGWKTLRRCCWDSCPIGMLTA